ncbi:MAG: SsrA-binding protein SmpB [Christensenellales bacterium]
MAASEGRKIAIQNRRAHHEYFVEDRIEAGLVLGGTEVKSLRKGRGNLQDSYIQIRDGEAFVLGFHISPYEQGNIFNRDPLREKKLLLHKAEIRKLQAQVMRDGYAGAAVRIFFQNRAKLEVGVCRGKQLSDKRAAARAKDDAREMERAFRERQK